MSKVKALLHEFDQFNDLVAQPAAQVGVDPSIVMKDYWVFEALRRLSESKTVGILFKGGTSLSMAYGLIRRFSEDIDLIVYDKEKGFENKPGQSRAVKLLKAAQDIVCSSIDLRYDPHHAGNFVGKNPCKRVCAIMYPNDGNAVQGVLPYVKLEMAVHSGLFPRETKAIISMVARQIEKQAPESLAVFSNTRPVQIECIDPLRTFAEKVNAILIFPRFKGRGLPGTFSDVAYLFKAKQPLLKKF